VVSCVECVPGQMCVVCWDRSIDEDTTLLGPEVVSERTQILRDRAKAWKKANPENGKAWGKKNRVMINLRRNKARKLRRELEK